MNTISTGQSLSGNKRITSKNGRDKPVLDPSSSKLQLSEGGNLVLYNQSEIPLWSTDLSFDSMSSTVVVLENSGNFVLRNSSNLSVIVWQSFDHPTELAGAKLGIDKMTRRWQIYIAWRNSTDPASGPFSLGLDPNGTSKYHILQNGNKYWICGMWLERVFIFQYGYRRYQVYHCELCVK
ncbi:hypothetical protein DITRI_Ditri01bG0145900 [Diplodiscus trichospermus]